jgi:hypothetical protein
MFSVKHGIDIDDASIALLMQPFSCFLSSG